MAAFATDSLGETQSYLIHDHSGMVDTLTGPIGAATPEALGVNTHDEVVGVDTDQQGAQHGFTWTKQACSTTVDDPHQMVGVAGAGTTINGVNDTGDLVGFFTDGNSNIDGMPATLAPDPARLPVGQRSRGGQGRRTPRSTAGRDGGTGPGRRERSGPVGVCAFATDPQQRSPNTETSATIRPILGTDRGLPSAPHLDSGQPSNEL